MEKSTNQTEGSGPEVAAGESEHGKSEKEVQNDTINAEEMKMEEKEKGGEMEDEQQQQPKGNVETTNSKIAETPLTTRLHVGHLTRNVTEEHLRMIFSVWGPLKSVEIAIDPAVQLPKGYAYVEFEKREDAENALDHMHGGQVDGNIVDVKFVQTAHKREPSPVPIPRPRPEPIPVHHGDQRGRPSDADRRRSPIRYRRRSPIRRHSRSPPRRRSPYRHRSHSPPPRRNYNGGYAYGNRGPSPGARRRRSPYRARRRSPSPRYHRREPARVSPSKRSRRSSSSGSSSISKSSSMSSSASSSASSSK